VSLFVLSREIEDRDEDEALGLFSFAAEMLHLTSSRLWTFLLLGFEVFQIRLQKKATLALSIEIHKGAIFDCLKIKTVAILLR
jgi:hypothetical protein